MAKTKKTVSKRKQRPFDEYVKYSAIAFQMMAALGLGAWVGHYFDERQATEMPVYTLIGLLVGLGLKIIRRQEKLSGLSIGILLENLVKVPSQKIFSELWKQSEVLL